MNFPFVFFIFLQFDSLTMLVNFSEYCQTISNDKFCLNSTNLEQNLDVFLNGNQTTILLDDAITYNFSMISALNISRDFEMSSYNENSQSQINFTQNFCFKFFVSELHFSLNNIIFINENSENQPIFQDNSICENTLFLIKNAIEVSISLINITFENISMLGETNLKAYLIQVETKEDFSLNLQNIQFINVYMKHFCFIEHSSDANVFYIISNVFNQKISILNFNAQNLMMESNSSFFEFYSNYNFIKIENLLLENMVIFEIKTFIVFYTIFGLNYILFENVNLMNIYDKAMILDSPFSSDNGLITTQSPRFYQFICSHCTFLNISLNFYEIFRIIHLNLARFENLNFDKFIIQNSNFINIKLKANSLMVIQNVTTYIIFCNFENLSSSVEFQSEGRLILNGKLTLKSTNFLLEYIDLLFIFQMDSNNKIILSVQNCSFINKFSKFGSFFYIDIYNVDFSFIKVKFINSLYGNEYLDYNPMISFRSTNAIGIMKEVKFFNSERKTISSLLATVYYMNIQIIDSQFVNNTQASYSLINNADLKFFCSSLTSITIINTKFQGFLEPGNKQTTIFCLNCNLIMANCQFINIRTFDFANIIMRSSYIYIFNCTLTSPNIELNIVNYFLHSIASEIRIDRLNYIISVDFLSDNIVNNNGILFYCEQSLLQIKNSVFHDVFTNKSLISMFDSNSDNLIMNTSFYYTIANPKTKTFIDDHFIKIFNGFCHFYMNSVNIKITNITIQTNFKINVYQIGIFSAIINLYLPQNSSDVNGLGNGFIMQAEKSTILFDNAIVANTFSIRAGNMVILNSNVTISNSIFDSTFAFLFASILFQSCYQIQIINNTFINNGGFEYGTFYIIQDNDDNLSGFHLISQNTFITTLDFYFVNMNFSFEKQFLLKYFLKFKLKFLSDTIYGTITPNNMFFGDFLKINMFDNNVIFLYPKTGNLVFINSTNPSFLNISNLAATNIYPTENQTSGFNYSDDLISTNNSFIQIQGSSSIIILNNSTFNNLIYYNTYGGALLVYSDPSKISTVIIKNCTFNNVSIYKTGEGGAIYFDSIKAFIHDSNFNNCLAAEIGGALSIYNTEISFTNTHFTNCCSKIGGAIFWSIIEPVFDKNVTFTNNAAYYGNHIANDIFQRKIFCFSNEFSYKTFNHNQMNSIGKPPKFYLIDNSTISSEYIRDGWIDINPEDFLNDDPDEVKCETFSKKNNSVFGFKCGNVSFLLNLIDYFNGTFLLATFDIYDQYVDLNLFRNLVDYNFMSFDDSIAPLNAIDFTFVDGLINLIYFKFDFPYQNSNQTTTFADNNLIDTRMNITSNSFSKIFDHYSQLCPFTKNLTFFLQNVTMHSPSCDKGLVYSDFKCNLCYNDKYSRTPNATTCNDTTTYAYYGCAQSIIPMIDYWIDEKDPTITLCPVSNVCGFYPNFSNGISTNNETCTTFLANYTKYNKDYIYNTTCKVAGYYGRLCTSCDLGYSRASTKYYCDKCPENAIIYGLVGILGLSIFYFYMVMTSRDYTANIPITELFKIISNFCIFYTVAFNRLTDLNEIQEMVFVVNATLKLQSSIASPQTSFFSFRCFVREFYDERTVDDDDHSFSKYLFYFEKALTLATPLIFFLIFFMFEFLYAKLKRRSDKKFSFWGLIKNSLFVIHFVFFNDVIRVCLTFLNLRPLNGKKVLDDEMEITDTDDEFQYFFYFVIFYMILYAFLIPAYGFYLLWMHKKDLNNPRFKEKYGFLYVGYSYKVYYWEFIINNFKFLMLIMETNIFQYYMSTYLELGDFDPAVLALVFLFTIRAIYFILVMHIYPFKSKFLNNLEQTACFFSLLIIILILIPKYFFLFPIKIYGSQSMFYNFLSVDLSDSDNLNLHDNKDLNMVMLYKKIILYVIVSLMIFLFFYIILFIIKNIISDIYSIWKKFRSDFLIWISQFKCIKKNFLHFIAKMLWMQIELLKSDSFSESDLEKITKLHNYVRVLHILNTKHMIKNFVKFLKLKAVNFSYRMFRRSLNVIKNFLLETHYIIPKIKKETMLKTKSPTQSSQVKRTRLLSDRGARSVYERAVTSKLDKRPADYMIERKKQEEAFEKTIQIFHSLNEEKYSKEEINQFLKKELMLYIKRLSEIDRIFKSKKIYKRLVRLNNNERTVQMFIFVIDIMISNLKRIEKIQSRKSYDNDVIR